MPELEKRQWDVFISHANEDADRAREIKDAIEDAGWKCFLAVEDLNVRIGSAQWSKRIDEALDGCGALILLTSPEAFSSHWVEYEWRTVHDDILSGKPGMVIPCCIRGMGPVELGRALRRYQAVDFRSSSGRESSIPNLLDLIEGYLKHPINAGNTTQPRVRILSIEGAGVRSILPNRLLVELECKLIERCGSDAQIGDLFDLIVGNSFGGLTACWIARGGSVKELQEYLDGTISLFFRRASILQKFTNVYDSREMVKLFRTLFGNTTMSKLERPCLVPVYDLASEEPLFLSSYHARKNSALLDLTVANAVSASCSSPVYFKPVLHEIDTGSFVQMIDGSVFEPDPTRLAFDEARRLIRPRPLVGDICMLSVGSGVEPKSVRLSKPVKPNLLYYAGMLPSIMMRSSAAATQEMMKGIFERQSVSTQYIRINPELPPPIETWQRDSMKSIQKIKSYSDEAAKEFSDHLDQFLDMTLLQ